jgi:Spy/CpxP family protein refolding chaperone
MSSKSTLSAATVAAVVSMALIALSPAQAQNASSPALESGGEPANWGLAPFVAIPAITLRAEDRAAIRALEDQHIKERRAFEDKYETELRNLIRKQAEEREALRTRLSIQR